MDGHSHGHAHAHSHGEGHGHGDDDHLTPPDTSQVQTLYPYIDHDHVVALNAATEGSGAAVLRRHADRLETAPLLESDADEELLLTIPFTGLVRLHSVLLRSPADERAPDTVRLFKNRQDLDFDNVADAQATQTLRHPAGVGIGTADEGIVEYAVNRAHLSNLTALTLHVASNHGGDTSALSYIGLRGDWTRLSKAPVVATYEAAANPADHKVKGVRDRERGLEGA